MKSKTEERSANLELLRILCMFMIVLAHCIGHGGVADAASLSEVNKQIIAMIQAMISVLINCFVLISGYFMSQNQFQIKKCLDIWLIALFWSVTLTVGCMMTGLSMYSGKEILKACLPFTQQQYWFVTTYLLMYLLVPMLNAVANHLDQRKFASFLIIFFVVFFLLQNVVFWREFTQMGIRDPLFFGFLYLVAAYVRRFPAKRKYPWGLGYLFMCVAIRLSGIASEFLPGYIASSFQATAYNQVFVVLASIFLFMSFLNLDIQTVLWKKLILTVSPLTFGVYLIHDNNTVRRVLWKALFEPEIMAADVLVVPKVFLISLLVFLCCLPLEALRRKLFQILRISKLCDNIGEWINKILLRVTVAIFHV